MNPCFTRTVFLHAPRNGNPSLRHAQKPAEMGLLSRKTACHLPRQASQFAPWAEAATHRLDPPM